MLKKQIKTCNPKNTFETGSIVNEKGDYIAC